MPCYPNRTNGISFDNRIKLMMWDFIFFSNFEMCATRLEMLTHRDVHAIYIYIVYARPHNIDNVANNKWITTKKSENN